MSGDSPLNAYLGVNYVTRTPPDSPLRELKEVIQRNLIAVEGYDGNLYTGIATRTPKNSGEVLEGLARAQYPPLIQEIIKKNMASEENMKNSHRIKVGCGLKEKRPPVSKTDIIRLEFLLGETQCSIGLEDKLKKYGFIN